MGEAFCSAVRLKGCACARARSSFASLLQSHPAFGCGSRRLCSLALCGEAPAATSAQRTSQRHAAVKLFFFFPCGSCLCLLTRQHICLHEEDSALGPAGPAVSHSSSPGYHRSCLCLTAAAAENCAVHSVVTPTLHRAFETRFLLRVHRAAATS